MSKLLDLWTGMTATVLPFAGATAPEGWLLCDGAAVSRATYAALFAKTGTAFGAGNGTTTFNLPDLRGEFVRGLDGGRGVDTGRTLGSKQKGTLQTYQDNVDPLQNPNTLTLATGDNIDSAFGMDPIVAGDGYSGTTRVIGQQSSQVSTLWGVTRPRNVALNHIIKT